MEKKKQFEKLLDSQCFRSSGNLPYMPVDQKLYYRESDVLTFIGEHLQQGNKNILKYRHKNSSIP